MNVELSPGMVSTEFTREVKMGAVQRLGTASSIAEVALTHRMKRNYGLRKTSPSRQSLLYNA